MSLPKLRDDLARLYPDKYDAWRVADDAGVKRENIDFSTNARNIWHQVLSEAGKNHQIEQLIEVVGNEYPAIRAVYPDFRTDDDEIDAIDKPQPLARTQKATLFSLTIWRLTLAVVVTSRFLKRRPVRRFIVSITIASLLFALLLRWPQAVQTLKKIYENLRITIETPVPLTPTPTLSFTPTSESLTATPTPTPSLTAVPDSSWSSPMILILGHQEETPQASGQIQNRTTAPIFVSNNFQETACSNIISALGTVLEQADSECSEINTGWACMVSIPVDVVPVEFRFFEIRDRRPIADIQSIQTLENGVVRIRMPTEGVRGFVDILAYGSSSPPSIITISNQNGQSLCNETPLGLFSQPNNDKNQSISINGFEISYPLQELSFNGGVIRTTPINPITNSTTINSTTIELK